MTEISFLGLYEIDWQIEYEDLKEEPVVKPNLGQIQVLTKVSHHPIDEPEQEDDFFFEGRDPHGNFEVESVVRENG